MFLKVSSTFCDSPLWKCQMHTPKLQRGHHSLRTQSCCNLLIFNWCEHHLQRFFSRELLRDLSHTSCFKDGNKAWSTALTIFWSSPRDNGDPMGNPSDSLLLQSFLGGWEPSTSIGDRTPQSSHLNQTPQEEDEWTW